MANAPTKGLDLHGIARSLLSELSEEERERLAQEIAPRDIMSPAQWLRENGEDLAPLTGTDHRALEAIAATWVLYAYTRSSLAILAVHSLLAVMQPKCRPITKKLIARAMDWSDIDQLWDRVSS